MPYSQAAVLMLQEKQNSDLASALPKSPSLHHGKSNMLICFKLGTATSVLKELEDI